MECLSLRYHLKTYDNIFVVQDGINSNPVVAFKANDCEFNKFKEILYFGDSKKLVNIFKDNSFFKDYNQNLDTLKIVRNYTELLRPFFISENKFLEYVNYAESIIIERKKFTINWFLNNEYNELKELISKLPFIDVIEKESGYKCDILIGKPRDISNIDNIDNLTNHILYVENSDDTIDIGPIIDLSKYQIPNFNLNKNNKISIMHNEQMLMYFFIERILYIQLFGINNKIKKNEFFPSRSKICINRVSMGGHSDVVNLRPKYIKNSEMS